MGASAPIVKTAVALASASTGVDATHHCKECGGASLCEHGRLRAVCKEYGGASICEHYCEHGHRRTIDAPCVKSVAAEPSVSTGVNATSVKIVVVLARC